MKLFYTIAFLLVFTLLKAQEAEFKPAFGGQLGLILNFGSQVNRLGLEVSAFHARDHGQLNGGLRWMYNFTSWGPKDPRPELQAHLGLVLAAGTRDTSTNHFVHLVSNQTGRKYSAGYAYQWYLERSTGQASGTLGLQFGSVELIVENDALGGEGQDKFRTGALQLAFRHFDSRYSVNAILWTGNTHGKMTCKEKEPGDYPCRFGYKDISAAHCGRYSHGVFALGYQRYLGYGQRATARIGFDAERIRHILQNKLIHDMPFLPLKWNKVHNPHLPMLDENGEPYLFFEDQKIRPSKFFFDLGTNGGLFY